ncbi:leucine-rich repeat-containing protein 70 [Tiliqua scincoides]|uniref:leucine-rich repeat-containing protein 70 n=1 Tax=Tiliqua scincoides TaxID=71010 RepID=UPI003462C640
MRGRVKAWDMCQLLHLGFFQHILNCLLLLLIQKEILCCPSVCRHCTGKQADCRNSGLSSIPKDFPQSTAFIYLSGNNLSHLYPNELLGLQQLAELHLDNSSILYVYPKAFVEFKKLWYLHLNNNQIKDLDPGTFEGLSNLHSLCLQNNEITFVPRGLFSDLTSVQYLMLQSNRLSILGSGTFFGMISLRILNLANNKISRISNAAFHHLDNLTCLYLEGNNLTCVPSNAFEELNNLERLSLSQNPIGSIPPFAFKGLEKLEYLSLRSANITTISVNGFSGLNNLKKLVLSNNNLENVTSSTFALLDNLMFLQLDRNKIIYIADNTFEKMGSSLKILNLAFNNIIDLQSDVFKPLVSLTLLQANNNPLNCSCRLYELINWLVSSSISVKMYCQNPSNLRGRHLNYVQWRSFINCLNPTTRSKIFKTIKSVGIHHSTTTESMVWNRTPKHDTVHELYLRNMDANKVIIRANLPTISASQQHDEECSRGMLRETTTVPAQVIPVNLTVDENRVASPEAFSVSFETPLLCTEQMEKLNQSFEILLTFFILACAVIFFLIYKIIQFKQRLNIQKNSDNRIEYYGFYQAGRYNITDPNQSIPQNSLGSSGLGHSRLSKPTAFENQAQVILFEHSAL